MTAYLNLRNLFDLFCIAQGITTAGRLLLQPRGSAHRWLALLIVGLTCQVIDYFLSRSGIYYRNRWLYFSPLFFSWGFGAFVYGYVRARTTPTQPFTSWHFVPLALQILFYLILVFQPLPTKAWFWLTVHKPYTRYVEYYVSGLLMLSYLYLSWKRVQQTPDPAGWMKPALRGLAFFYGLALLDPLINFLYLSPQDTRFFFTAQLFPIFTCIAALTGHTLTQVHLPAKILPASSVNKEHQDQIQQAIHYQKLYQNPELTLVSLAARLGLSPNVVSRTINTGFGQSFAEYINTHRVEEVKRRLEAGDAERFTLLALALEAGFPSKTTFNRVFKEQTGCTPKMYQKKCHSMIRDDPDL
ncbi:hypothetical protein BWI97_22835 [Siphonobacter sp. BAB-5405]|uniref:helix-turn-helix domain-containing protein n=1 Tax=Siphonobacter sp. BAB-5405 TaxID=1864825 RepID=UPI000C808983|nr:helix-turn-helix domain-containing protein [Siphonobacter sp. BAB-5405]PMD90332.1 hypothetical protein BWI97_22835 [Siphonobacter sp. BAB-5405]